MDEKKIALDQAAQHIFANNGYKHTNIAEIAKAANISVGSFYKFYNSKEEIFLQIYIKENERIRKKVIDETDWQGDPIRITLNIFEHLKKELLNNKILSEWNNPKISSLLRDYYKSEEGVANNNFHQFVLDYIQKYLLDSGFEAKEVQKITRVYELIYHIDCNVEDEAFPDKTEVLQTLLTYFIQGIIHHKA
ncbi:MAG: TetR/AcrR family transcriptional regulator [Peptostreptococcaceae bacterium]|nr:TetR/AcrR family transcriptional regulator [Peptostreptococcaceae bacterium]